MYIYIPHGKNPWPLPHAIHKNQPKIVIGLNVNGKAIHLFEEYIGKMFSWPWHFLDIQQRVWTT